MVAKIRLHRQDSMFFTDRPIPHAIADISQPFTISTHTFTK